MSERNRRVVPRKRKHDGMDPQEGDKRKRRPVEVDVVKLEEDVPVAAKFRMKKNGAVAGDASAATSRFVEHSMSHSSGSISHSHLLRGGSGNHHHHLLRGGVGSGGMSMPGNVGHPLMMGGSTSSSRKFRRGEEPSRKRDSPGSGDHLVWAGSTSCSKPRKVEEEEEAEIEKSGGHNHSCSAKVVENIVDVGPCPAPAPLAESEKEMCGICFDTIEDRGILNCCAHMFCFSCIGKWLERSSRCAHCKRVVSSFTSSKTGLTKMVERRELIDTLMDEEESSEDEDIHDYLDNLALLARGMGYRVHYNYRTEMPYPSFNPIFQVSRNNNNSTTNINNRYPSSLAHTFDSHVLATMALFDGDDDENEGTCAENPIVLD